MPIQTINNIAPSADDIVNSAIQSEIAFQAAQPAQPASQAEFLVFAQALVNQGMQALAIGSTMQFYSLPPGYDTTPAIQDIFRRLAALAAQALAADPTNVKDNAQGAAILTVAKSQQSAPS